MWEIGPYVICKQRRSCRVCAFVQSDPDIICRHTLQYPCSDSVNGLQRPLSACTNAQGWSGPVLSTNCTSCTLYIMSHDIKILYLWTYAPSKDSDQPAHMCSLIRIFKRMQTFFHAENQDSDQTVCVCAVWFPCWAHMWDGTFSCIFLAHIYKDGPCFALKFQYFSC